MADNKFEINLSWVAILALVAIILWILDTPQPAQSQDTSFMVLRAGAHGLNFQCLDERPYSISHAMHWDAELGATELNGRNGRLEYQVIEVTTCNLDNVYSHSGNWYAWLFTSHQTDEHPTHRHLTRGAWWITNNLNN